MKYRSLTYLIIVTIVFVPGQSFAEDLKGKVVFVGKHDELTPAVGIDVVINETGDSGKTKAGGLFRISLPQRLKARGSVTLSVWKSGWVIQYPLDGETPIPTNLDTLIHVRLVPKGSKKLWSADRIEKFIRDTADKAKEQFRASGRPQTPDFARYIKDWAAWYGLSPQQAREEIAKWASEAEEKHDLYRLGLAAYARKNFGGASNFFETSAEEKLRLAQEASSSAQRFSEEAIRDFQLAGNAHLSNHRFDQALVNYQRARELTPPADQPYRWAYLTVLMGIVEHEIGIRAEGKQIQNHLDNSASAYRTALKVFTRETFPQAWAWTHTNLGDVLRNQGIRTFGEGGASLLAQALAAHHEALTVFTKEASPYDWAWTQTSLALVLYTQSASSKGEDSTSLLTQAVAAHRAALTVFTKQALPQDWAKTQINLGDVLGHQGAHIAGDNHDFLLSKSIEAYRAALTVFTKETFPQHWATAQSNLGHVLYHQATHADSETRTSLFSQALEAYHDALTVFTKEVFPQNWATTQVQLGNTLRDHGTLTRGETGVLLQSQAIAAYQAALAVLPKDGLLWSLTKYNLFLAQRSQEFHRRLNHANRETPH